MQTIRIGMQTDENSIFHAIVLSRSHQIHTWNHWVNDQLSTEPYHVHVKLLNKAVIAQNKTEIKDKLFEWQLLFKSSLHINSMGKWLELRKHLRVKDTSILRADTVSGVICSEMESYLKRADYQENFEWFDGYVQVSTWNVMKDPFSWTFNGMNRCVGCGQMFVC